MALHSKKASRPCKWWEVRRIARQLAWNNGLDWLDVVCTTALRVASSSGCGATPLATPSAPRFKPGGALLLLPSLLASLLRAQGRARTWRVASERGEDTQDRHTSHREWEKFAKPTDCNRIEKGNGRALTTRHPRKIVL
eukprot:COSAG06_NODE_578_length_14043_cov_3.556153_6_plen_139_part_00